MDRRWILAVGALLVGVGLFGLWSARGTEAPAPAAPEATPPAQATVTAPKLASPPPDADFDAARAHEATEADGMFRVYERTLGWAAYLSCAVEGVPDLTPGVIEVRKGQQNTRSQIAVVDGKVRVAVGWPDGEVVLRLRGFAATPSSWAGAAQGAEIACGPLQPARSYAMASGRVADASGAAITNGTVQGCGGASVIDTSGTFRIDAEPGDCTLVPKARIGDWEVTGAELDVGLIADSDNPVALEFVPEGAVLADAEVEGSGRWAVGFESGGVRVLQVPAGEQRAGQGDLLASIDGVPVAGADPQAQLEAIGALTNAAAQLTKGP